jgi:hypothetical protein
VKKIHLFFIRVIPPLWLPRTGRPLLFETIGNPAGCLIIRIRPKSTDVATDMELGRIRLMLPPSNFAVLARPMQALMMTPAPPKNIPGSYSMIKVQQEGVRLVHEERECL